MNKKVLIALIIVIVIAILVVWRVISLESPTIEQGQESTQVTETAPTNTESIAPMLSREELALHATANDCWIAYETTVYDVTDWLKKHPGGSAAIARFCGTVDEFTKAFEGQHGEKQQNLLPSVGQFQGTLILEN